VLEELQERKGSKTDKGKCARGMALDPGSWAGALRCSCGDELLGLIARGMGQSTRKHAGHIGVCSGQRAEWSNSGKVAPRGICGDAEAPEGTGVWWRRSEVPKGEQRRHRRAGMSVGMPGGTWEAREGKGKPGEVCRADTGAARGV
jgi:hypothetical protein